MGFRTASERFYSEALAAGRLQFAVSTLHMIAVHPLIGWGLGVGLLLIQPSPLLTPEPSSIRHIATGCSGLRKGTASWASDALAGSLGNKARASFDLGNRYTRCSHSRRFRLSLFAPGNRGMADSDPLHGGSDQPISGCSIHHASLRLNKATTCRLHGSPRLPFVIATEA